MVGSHFVTVRDPRDSVWQSIVEKVAKGKLTQAAPRTSFGKQVAMAAAAGGVQAKIAAFVEAAHAEVYERDEASQSRIPDALSIAPTAGVGMVAAQPKTTGAHKNCASLALDLAKAEAFGTIEQVQAVKNVFDFSTCDPFWSECVKEYVNFYKLHSGKIPYRDGINNVLPGAIPANATIAIFGDWGTGEQVAVELLQQIKGFNPDILMHLGDVYYSGTQDEVQERHLDVCQEIFGASMPMRFSLSGNHDMYSGGDGYYWLVDQLGQKASYFAIQNADWLFIAMDTGVNDFNPLKLGSVASFVRPTEATWVNNLVANKGSKKAVLFSHHPPFSAYDPMSGAPVNPILLNQLSASLSSVTAWFWGHEHRLGVYDPFQNVQRGRCLGHAAVPVFASAAGDPPKLAGVPVHLEGGSPLDMGQDGGFFKHGFAIMALNGQYAKVSYYREGATTPLWEETF